MQWEFNESFLHSENDAPFQEMLQAHKISHKTSSDGKGYVQSGS